MKPSQKLELRQGQSLVMTAQLQQSIKLLQLSAIELSEFVEQELERNPLLARDEAEQQDNKAEPAEAGSESGDDGDAGGDEKMSGVEMLDSNYGNGWQDDELRDRANRLSAGSHDRAPARSASYDDSGVDLEQTLSNSVTLQEHLTEQLQVDMDDPKMRMLARQLIDMLDDSGFLREDPEQIAQMFGASLELVEQTLSRLKQFDPAGIFSRDLKECIRIQLQERNALDPLMAALVDHIHMLEKGDLKGLQKICGASDEDFRDMLAEIRTLDPYPARQFVNDMAQAVIPDVFVRGGKDGIWQVELNHDVLPKVLLDQRYYNELDTRTRDKESKKYLTEQLGRRTGW